MQYQVINTPASTLACQWENFYGFADDTNSNYGFCVTLIMMEMKVTIITSELSLSR